MCVCVCVCQTHALNTGSSGAEALKALLAPAGSAAAAALLHSDPDVDQQLLISVHFQNKVKLHSISFTAQELANAPDDGRKLCTHGAEEERLVANVRCVLQRRARGS